MHLPPGDERCTSDVVSVCDESRGPVATALKTPRRRRTPVDPGLQGQLRDRLVRLLEEGCLDPEEWARRIQALEAEAGPLTYSILIFVLARLDLPPGRARTYWEQVLLEWRGMNTRLGEPVDLRLAVLQYFLRRERKLENPAIVELRILHRTEDSAIVDELTRLYTSRHFEERLREEVRRAGRYQAPLSLLMIDADDFKAFNDTYGHLAGNAALRRLGQVLKRSVREVDFVARYGGEEFAILLPDTPKKGALQVAEKVRQAVARARIGGGTDRRTLTVSVGVACYPGDGSDEASSSRLRTAASTWRRVSARTRSRPSPTSDASTVGSTPFCTAASDVWPRRASPSPPATSARGVSCSRPPSHLPWAASCT